MVNLFYLVINRAGAVPAENCPNPVAEAILSADLPFFFFITNP